MTPPLNIIKLLNGANCTIHEDINQPNSPLLVNICRSCLLPLDGDIGLKKCSKHNLVYLSLNFIEMVVISIVKSMHEMF